MLLNNKTPNSIFVINKPCFVSSNKYLQTIKKKYKFSKVGFSGILDYFACGSLICASGSFTKLFLYLKKTPKIYRGVIWLGVTSDSLDLENILSKQNHKILDEVIIKKELKNLQGELSYIPSKYSAKKINGVKAYELARANKEVKLKQIHSQIFETTFLNYSHPFINFKISVSEGSYIRNIAQILLKNLNSFGTLSYLERLSEGDFCYDFNDNEKSLNIFNHLNMEQNFYLGDCSDIKLGKKLDIKNFKLQQLANYYIKYDDYFCIIKIAHKQEQTQEHKAQVVKVSYILNNIKLYKQ
jgi:tRNA pseudouridine55 synthase